MQSKTAKQNAAIGRNEVVYRSYVDALWTVHLAGSEAVTVSSGLADNMAKGIHLEQRGHTDKRPGQTKALDNKDSHAQRKGQSDSKRVP